MLKKLNLTCPPLSFHHSAAPRQGRRGGRGGTGDIQLLAQVTEAVLASWRLARQMVAHASPRTARLYDRRHGRMALDEIDWYISSVSWAGPTARWCPLEPGGQLHLEGRYYRDPHIMGAHVEVIAALLTGICWIVSPINTLLCALCRSIFVPALLEHGTRFPDSGD